MDSSSISPHSPDVATLADPVRRSLYRALIRSTVPLSRDQLVRTLNLAPSTASFHLERMVREGLLETESRKLGTRTGPGSGRPTKLYKPALDEVSVSIPAREYELAARLLASAIEASVATGEPVEEALRAVAYNEGQRLGLRAGNIEQALSDNGFEPETDGQGLALGNCPFHRLSRDHTQVVCGLNAALLQGTLDGCNDTQHRIEPAPESSACCARLTAVTE
ncbi:putative ArsR family transcriptional regulator [Arthrobacter sp. V4I6]|uniref:helix-turn-helix transcriptional regulator n=1 Tax=unclassified Arthrobacter TaxID=235627 RepID=UPI00277D327E|nr:MULTISPECIES: helix-turn-helix domain-containing protein [unclassified Arthrobacter]MDQ0822534.1 putative ArsR family transcriptional regulator [Arthrobacter sp. V1I7]MDQ0852161.1 putative ArsR family transcriptional regulator [Arthrobacter sp. V4I6]